MGKERKAVYTPTSPQTLAVRHTEEVLSLAEHNRSPSLPTG